MIRTLAIVAAIAAALGAAAGGGVAWRIRTADLVRLRLEMAEQARHQAEETARANEAAIAELAAQHAQQLAALRADRDAADARARRLSTYRLEVQRNAPALDARLPADVRDALNRLLERSRPAADQGQGGAPAGRPGGPAVPPAAGRPARCQHQPAAARAAAAGLEHGGAGTGPAAPSRPVPAAAAGALQSAMPILKAGLVYFLQVFGAGFALAFAKALAAQGLGE